MTCLRCFDCDLLSSLLVVSGKLGEALTHFPELFGWFVVEFLLCTFHLREQRCSWIWCPRCPPRVMSCVDGSCMRSDCSLHGWIGPEPEASSLARGRVEFQDLVNHVIIEGRSIGTAPLYGMKGIKLQGCGAVVI